VQNATNGTGFLQTADGALSQVTSLLNRATTLATEASTSGITTGSNSQAAALNTEFNSILNEITSIGQNTNFNGAAVFGTSSAGTLLNVFMSDGTSSTGSSSSVNINQLSSTNLGLGATASASISGNANAAANDVVTIGQTTYTFKTAAAVAADGAATKSAGANGVANSITANVDVALGGTMAQTLQNLAAAVNGSGVAGTQYQTGAIANVDAQASLVTPTSVTITADISGLGAPADVVPGQLSAATGTFIAASFTTHTGGLNMVGGTTTLTGGSGAALDLSNTTDAANALTAITTAINTVASQRGVIGAEVNRLAAATNVMNNQIQNLTSAQSGITDADIGTTVANMSKYNTLSQTGISALQQANQASQAILKLLQ
jgi:flagellin